MIDVGVSEFPKGLVSL